MNKVLLGDVAEEVRENYNETDGNPAVVGLEHLIPGEIRLKEWSEDTNTTFTKAFHKGQVLFGRRRAYLKKAAVAPVDGICSGDITVISAKPDKILPELLPFVIQNDDFFDFAVGKSAGSLSPRVKWSRLKEYEFNLPSLPQQKELAKLLWSFVDAKEAYEDLIHQTDELVKSQFIEMFGEPSKSDEAVPLERAFEIRDDLRKPLNDVERSQMKEGQLYPYYGANGQVDTINDYMIDGQALCLAEDCGAYGAGDVTSYIIKGRSWVNNHAHVLFPRKECDIEYANAFFRILDMSEYVSGTTRLKLTQGKMKEIPVVLPPMNEQRTFADIVEQSDKSKFELNEAIKDLDAMYKRIIKDNLG